MTARGKYQVGFCTYCGKDTAIRKSDQKVFRHPDPDNNRIVCPGTGRYPSMLVDEYGDVTQFVPIEIIDRPIHLEAEQGYEYDTLWEQRVPVTNLVSPEAPMMLDLIGKELPVITEAGVVVGRARIEMNCIRILGPKWAQRTA